MGVWAAILGMFRGERAADDEPDADATDPFEGRTDFPVTDELDLHGLPPKSIPDVVVAYLDEARRLGFDLVRIVHGKGEGVQRARVRAILERTDFVEAYDDAPADRGGWGATVARLRPADSSTPAPRRET